MAVGAIGLLELCNEGVPAGGEQLEVDVQLGGHLVAPIDHLEKKKKYVLYRNVKVFDFQ